VLDAVEIILRLAGSTESVGTRELARSMGLEQTRVSRLLKTLAASGIAHQGPDRRYGAGPAMHVLGAMSLQGSGLLRAAEPALERLTEFGMIVALGVLWRRQVSYLFHWQPGMAFVQAIGRVGLVDAANSSIGMALLSKLPDQTIEELYQPEESVAGFSSRRAFLDLLTDTRRTGVAVIPNGEGGSTRAAVVENGSHQPVAAVALSGPVPVAPVRELDAAVLRAAQETAGRLIT
jgi:DNA-binding IclR family transcriptional regulator